MSAPVLRASAYSLGCKLNTYETEAMLEQLSRAGWEIVPWHTEAELLLVDTCTVTDRADQKARQVIRAALRRYPEAMMVVTGCYCQVAAEEIAAIEGVDLVLGNLEKGQLLEHLGLYHGKQAQAQVIVGPSASREERRLLPVGAFHKQTRAFLKVQDGCDVFCSYCIVPLTRGRSRSLIPGEVLAQASRLVAAGHPELVLTGVHIGDYGRDLPGGITLTELCKCLLQLPDLKRLRLSSIEPWDVSHELIELMAGEPRLCAHLHTAIQSGSARVLKRMRRRITRRGLLDLFEEIGSRIPHIGLGTDVMTGFPGENDADFAATVDMIQRVPFSNLHVFPYSERKGTRAVEMSEVVPRVIRKERANQLLELGRKKKADWQQRWLGSTQRVLLERDFRDGALSGFTSNYLRVKVNVSPENVAEVAGCVWNVRLMRVEGEVVLGELVSDPCQSSV